MVVLIQQQYRLHDIRKGNRQGWAIQLLSVAVIGIQRQFILFHNQSDYVFFGTHHSQNILFSQWQWYNAPAFAILQPIDTAGILIKGNLWKIIHKLQGGYDEISMRIHRHVRQACRCSCILIEVITCQGAGKRAFGVVIKIIASDQRAQLVLFPSNFKSYILLLILSIGLRVKQGQAIGYGFYAADHMGDLHVVWLIKSGILDGVLLDMLIEYRWNLNIHCIGSVCQHIAFDISSLQLIPLSRNLPDIQIICHHKLIGEIFDGGWIPGHIKFTVSRFPQTNLHIVLLRPDTERSQYGQQQKYRQYIAYIFFHHTSPSCTRRRFCRVRFCVFNT